MMTVVERVVFVFGLRRSGNHAIIHWLLRQAPGARLFLNDVPLGSLADALRGKIHRRRVARLVVSFEDEAPAVLPDVASLLPSVRCVHAPQTLLVIRNPYDALAGRMKRRSLMKLPPERFPGVWKLYAEYALGLKRLDATETIPAFFDRWRQSEDYRRSLAARLHLPFTDQGFDEVPPFGGGSSFDGLAFDRRAADMETSERWKRMTDDERFQRCLADATLLEYARRLGLLGPELDAWAASCLSRFGTSDARPTLP